jgi:hydroxymethylpyrimidine pyrophosphatase-like HAD family hydrolase
MKAKDNKAQKKVLIFDVNPSDDDITKELILGKVLQVIKKCSLNRHVVFLSHSTLSLLKKMVNDMGIKQGYIISDCGARIYNLHDNKIIFQESLELYDSLSIAHSSLVNENLILASCDTQEIVYSPNPLYRDSLSKKHYVKLRHMDSFVGFAKFINTHNIYSIMV